MQGFFCFYNATKTASHTIFGFAAQLAGENRQERTGIPTFLDEYQMNPSKSGQEIADLLRLHAQQQGFHLFGIAPAIGPDGYSRLMQWIEAGYDGEMAYLSNRLPAYQHPKHVLSAVRSIIMLGFPYRTEEPIHPGKLQGRVARYAWGKADYHDVIHARLKELRRYLLSICPESKARGVVDTAPLLEREFAQLAGIGWAGKNTLLLNKHQGSFFFIAALLTDLDLPIDRPHESTHCGTCTRCLDACPTDAFIKPNLMDARRCISYLTIEHRGAIPMEFREGVGNWLFGCDICQEVCPWNRRGSATQEPSLLPQTNNNPVDLLELFRLSDQAFRQRFRKTPLWRSRRRGILRNAAICLGNSKQSLAIPVLLRALGDPEPLIRGAVAWALGQIGGTEAQTGLNDRLTQETDGLVQEEIRAAIKQSKKHRQD